ncbi:MAG: hypothetical protein IPM63_03960 [Acidobacteriota bacterium]|nr:MAG: hypothetical protein IPM63_03960 [Acidobacteriota bacterium]
MRSNSGRSIFSPGSSLIPFLAVLAIAFVGGAGSCGNAPNPRLADVPQRMLWAWERPEDLRFIDRDTTGVAFLAQTITLEGSDVIFRGRRQPLQIPEGTYVMAVTRVETSKTRGGRAEMNDEQMRRTAGLIARSAGLPNVQSVQVDFDAVVSERDFYRKLLERLRKDLPADMPLSITSLASWCVGDRWFGELPVDEVVPMAFEMGTDEHKIRSFLKDGNDWTSPACRESYGLLAGDDLLDSVDDSRRIYFFKRSAWEPKDAEKLAL